MGYLDLLTVVLVVLKLAEVIDWAWWVVGMPTFISMFIRIAFIIVCAWLAWRGEGR